MLSVCCVILCGFVGYLSYAETTLKGSVVIGGAAIFAAMIAIVSGLFIRKLPKETYDWNDAASINRAGLPSAGGQSGLEQASSARSIGSH